MFVEKFITSEFTFCPNHVMVDGRREIKRFHLNGGKKGPLDNLEIHIEFKIVPSSLKTTPRTLMDRRQPPTHTDILTP